MVIMNVRTVDVAIPTLNRPELLHAAVSSVLSQSHRDLHLTVIDNGSATPAEKILDDLPDPRLTICRNERTISRPDNYNLALRSGDAEFVAILADDDEWLPEFLSRALAIFTEHPDVAIVHTGYEAVDADGRVTSTVESPVAGLSRVLTGDAYIRLKLSGRHRIEFSATVLRRSVVPDCGFIPEDDVADDLGLLLRMAAGSDVGIVSKPLGRVRYHGGTVSASADNELVNDRYVRSVDYRRTSTEAKLRFLAEYAVDPAVHRRLRRLARRPLRRHLLVPAARTLRRPSDFPDAARRAIADTAVDRWALVDPGAWKRAAAALLERQR